MAANKTWKGHRQAEAWQEEDEEATGAEGTPLLDTAALDGTFSHPRYALVLHAQRL